MISINKITMVAISLTCQFAVSTAFAGGTVIGTGYSYHSTYQDGSICTDEQIIKDAKAEAFSNAERDGYHNCTQHWFGSSVDASTKVECNKLKDGHFSLKVKCVGEFSCSPY